MERDAVPSSTPLETRSAQCKPSTVSPSGIKRRRGRPKKDAAPVAEDELPLLPRKRCRPKKNNTPIAETESAPSRGILTPHGNDMVLPRPQKSEKKQGSAPGPAAASLDILQKKRKLGAGMTNSDKFMGLRWQRNTARRLATSGLLGFFKIKHVLCHVDPATGQITIKAKKCHPRDRKDWFWKDVQTKKEIEPRYPWMRCERLVWDQKRGSFLGVWDDTQEDNLERPPFQVPEASSTTAPAPDPSHPGLRSRCDPMLYPPEHAEWFTFVKPRGSKQAAEQDCGDWERQAAVLEWLRLTEP